MTDLLALDLLRCDEFEIFLTPDITAEADRFYISDVMFTRIPFADWAILENSRYLDPLEGLWAERTPPHFIVFSDPAATQDSDSIRRRTRDREAQIRTLTLALRLLARLDPPAADPTDYIAYRRNGEVLTITTSLAGRAGYEWPPRLVADHVQWLWTKAYETLQFLYRYRRCEGLERALNLFYRAGGLGVRDSDREILLHAALEAVCGTSVPRLAEVRWNDPEVAEAARTRRARRNALAHGELIGSAASRGPLRRLTSWVIIESIHQVLKDPSGKGATGAALLDNLKTSDVFGAERLYEISVDRAELLFGGLKGVPINSNHPTPIFFV
ncbi:hypothetical protein LQ938_11640 [Microbacterium sp. cx-55]|uniref:hypothetical protein n=1 Tax=Microbacterium sp. cx-55 TaxID=2875948 RepID=UPI001CC01A40|nr:hypothetical protein [Microbacterium sp. cx-55]MBZ4488075.1 hypothetical protein [Microbacterium sp. cx-55]UGB34519.1 hypothetical protein LQ938_11640 [Microbacterium sp. cx-55]